MQLTLKAVPIDGRLVLNLPPEFDEQLVTVQISDMEPASQSSHVAQKQVNVYIQTERIRALLSEVVIDNEYLRQEYLYEDRF
jgi:hypothetical protein